MQLLLYLRIRLFRHLRMIVGVACYLVAVLPCALYKSRIALGHLSDEEKGAVNAAGLESVKEPCGILTRGAVVKGQCDELVSVGMRR